MHYRLFYLFRANVTKIMFVVITFRVHRNTYSSYQVLAISVQWFCTFFARTDRHTGKQTNIQTDIQTQRKQHVLRSAHKVVQK